MTIQLSTGLRNALLATGGLKGTMALGKILIYTGTPPSDADQAITGTLLTTITVSSGATGISFDTAAAAGVILKAPGETWSGTNAATGTAGYYRHVAAGDTGVLSTTQARIQGSVATAGSDLNLSSVSLTSGATQTIDYYSVAMPAS